MALIKYSIFKSVGSIASKMCSNIFQVQKEKERRKEKREEKRVEGKNKEGIENRIIEGEWVVTNEQIWK